MPNLKNEIIKEIKKNKEIDLKNISEDNLKEIIKQKVKGKNLSDDSKKIENIIEDILNEIKNPKRGKTTPGEMALGFILGISLSWLLGFTGFIPYIIGIYFGTWVTKKALRSPNKYFKIIFWLAFIIMILFGIIIRGIYYEPTEYNFNNEQDIELIQTDKSADYSKLAGNIYRNTKYNFKIKFPEGWKIGVGNGPHIVQKASSGNSTISVFVQQFDIGETEGFSSIEDVGTVKEVVNSQIKGVKEKFSDVEIMNYGETKINNEPAYWVEYSASTQVLGRNLKMINIVYNIVKEDTMYVITAGTVADEYSDIKPLFVETINTFKLEDY